MQRGDRYRAYWRRNLLYVGILLAIWFAVSYGCGILFVDALDRVRIGGFKLGFWFAQQGSIYVFVALIFVYVFLMNRLDRSMSAEDEPPVPGDEARAPAPDTGDEARAPTPDTGDEARAPAPDTSGAREERG